MLNLHVYYKLPITSMYLTRLEDLNYLLIKLKSLYNSLNNFYKSDLLSIKFFKLFI